MTKRKSEEQERASAAPLAAELRAGATLEKIGARYQADVQKPEAFGKGAPVPNLGAAPAVTEAVFRTPVGQYGDPVVVSGKGVVLFRVDTRNDFDASAFAIQRPKLAETARQQEAQKLIQAELNRRRAQEKIVVNEDVLKKYAQG